MRDEPAFPHADQEYIKQYKKLPHPGLTKREYFAAMALGLCEKPSVALNWTEEDVAKSAVILADALIKELERDR